MPVITFEAATMTYEQKQQLVKEFTESASRITGVPQEAFLVLLKENSFENIGFGGQLISDIRSQK